MRPSWSGRVASCGPRNRDGGPTCPHHGALSYVTAELGTDGVPPRVPDVLMSTFATRPSLATSSLLPCYPLPTLEYTRGHSPAPYVVPGGSRRRGVDS